MILAPYPVTIGMTTAPPAAAMPRASASALPVLPWLLLFTRPAAPGAGRPACRWPRRAPFLPRCRSPVERPGWRCEGRRAAGASGGEVERLQLQGDSHQPRPAFVGQAAARPQLPHAAAAAKRHRRTAAQLRREGCAPLPRSRPWPNSRRKASRAFAISLPRLLQVFVSSMHGPGAVTCAAGRAGRHRG